MNPYPTVKAALGAAAHVSRPLDYPKPAASDRIQSVPDADALDAPIAVRAAIVRAGLEPDGEDADLLYSWATTADKRDDHARDVWDDALEETTNDAEYSEALRRGAAARARLLALVELVGPVLVEAGVVRRPPKLAVHPVGHRVVEDADGRRTVVMVVDPHPRDPTVYTGPNGAQEARRVARGQVEGHVVAHTVLVTGRKHPDLAAELGPRWDAGEFEALGDLDSEIVERLGCRPQHARRVRASWGIHGTRGRAPTRPDLSNVGQGTVAT